MTPKSSVFARPSCSPYPPEELNRFRKILVDQQTDLLRSCAGLSHVALKKAGVRGDDDSQVTDDPADLAAETCEQDISIQMLGRLQADLDDIRDALERIDERSYGACEECGKPIPATRLEAIPTADSCVGCKTAREEAA